MARPIVLSNGELHVGLNKWGMVHDFYFPYVGLENHAAGALLRHHVGVWVNGELSWTNNGDWQITSRYPHNALIGHTVARNDRLGLVLEFDDFVDASENAFLRNIHIINLHDSPKEVRLFMHQSFAIGDSRSNTDTAQYLPGSNAILHYRGRRAFVISGLYDDKPFDQHTVGVFGIEGREGTFKDAEDGELSFCHVEHGRVDSTIRFLTNIEPHNSVRVHYWIAAGETNREALSAHKQILEDGAMNRMHSTANWWHQWLEPAHEVAERIAPKHRKSFIQSLMIIKSQIDKRGAIMASTDTTMLNYARDAYSYSWPRDGALVVWPLIRLGYFDEPKRFFEFCQQGLQPDGYLIHKYRADGAFGSSWHPYVHQDGMVGPPIQEDGTALVLFMFAQFYQKNPDNKLLKEFYKSLVVPMANFLASYVDSGTGLPKPSYDLWEEVYLTTTFSTGVTYGALVAASELAVAMNDEKNAVAWNVAADGIQTAAHRYLFNHNRQAFFKGVLVRDGKITQHNEDIDSSSLFGAFMFGLFHIDSDEVKQAAQTTKEVFGFSPETPGLPRYENDYYYRPSLDVLGNWWPITSLWMAQFEIENGNQETAQRIVDWVQGYMLPSGVLAEQINPLTNETLSVSPLTWSHAEYVATLLDSIAGASQED